MQILDSGLGQDRVQLPVSERQAQESKLGVAAALGLRLIVHIEARDLATAGFTSEDEPPFPWNT